MKHSITLEYTLGEGWLAPWITGLRSGKAVASTCSGCKLAHFPPLLHCTTCNAKSDGWQTLDGGATILIRTTGADGDFALAKFDGAASAAVVRTAAISADAKRGVLGAVPEGPPQLRLEPEPLG